MFPPEYVPHGVQPLYDGEPVTLTPAQEEAVTFYAAMMDTDYVKKEIFRKNFWEDLKQLLGPLNKIQSFERMDLSPIYEWHQAQKLEKANQTKAERKLIREAKAAEEEGYKIALVDGQPQQVPSFKIPLMCD